MKLMSFAEGRWVEPQGRLTEVVSAVDGAPVGLCSSEGLNFGGMARYARAVGGSNLRKLTFTERAAILKRLAAYLMERKDELYDLSYKTGATKTDGWIDIEGGIGTLFAYASRGQRELPNEKHLIDGDVEQLSKGGSFVGLHVLTPLKGVAVHINAFNFPCWGLLEKFAPTFLAGVPVITKPATATAYLAEKLVRLMIGSGLLPEGSLQIIVGSTGDLLDHLTMQDVVSFTGSLETSVKLQAHPNILRNAVRFIAERDSLNASILGPDAGPGTPEFDLYVKEVQREMTTKAGQKCTAIRRAIVPRQHADAVAEALRARLAKVVVGNPQAEGVTMGALASHAQRDDVRTKIQLLRSEAQVVFGDPETFEVVGADKEAGAFLPPVLLRCDDPWKARYVHDVEPFGPVATIVPYDTLEDAVRLANRGEGSLVASVFTYDPAVADELLFGTASFHGRLVFIDRDCAKESTGHGSPLPHMIHGGPGRAGGSEEMGGLRGVKHYMQRTALQGSPTRLGQLGRSWIRGGVEINAGEHPFRRPFDVLQLGETLHTRPRTITMEDIEHFAEFTGDTFYAHMDEEAASANPFFPGRVAHGYLLLSFAAGLFVEPAPGPVLANYGLDNLRFLKPVVPGDAIKVRLTVKSKRARKEYGEVRWDVQITNQLGETVANYDLLTMNAFSNDSKAAQG
ncbi:phenylacetic acid degradation bifunctional protein PaaZ [Pedomonas mirosovicensis]|uniref:phenylacetic acid degradation bifunctional protein PaaZ n=1 Tax=Pedomonas mirosovicensis TaxID=2908641 RepID=UPI002169CFC1|nr:phenylacetic acid degradation bifunctional protein PaaZ [Pedomonas mirosovicensis]MCH8684519.1 phenylacetic acid degradation bifunctional protein PaaZ [Pedomonas mirosovicensis]